jgi:hypothetical protein
MRDSTPLRLPVAPATAKGVIHIGFVSSGKRLSLSRIFPRAEGPCWFGFRPLWWPRDSHSRNVPVASASFAPAKFVRIHLSGPPAAGGRLFRAVIHPDLDLGFAGGEGPGSHPDSVGTRTTSVPRRRSIVRPSRRTDVADPVTGPRNGAVNPVGLGHAGERDFDGHRSFHPLFKNKAAAVQSAL